MAKNASRSRKGGDGGLDVLLSLVCAVMLASAILGWAPSMTGTEVIISIVAFVLLLLHKRRLNRLIGIDKANVTPLAVLLGLAMFFTAVVFFVTGAWNENWDLLIVMLGLAFGMYLVVYT